MTRTIRRALLVSLALAANARAESKDEELQIAQQVHDIFEAKCIDCHGPELPRPKGKFGYVLDLKRVAENPDYIVRGEPQKSELYKMVFNDEMPGEDANVPPLTKEEKELVKRWVEIGAPGDLPATAGAHIPAIGPASAKRTDSLWLHALRWVGKFHPVSTHLPIALLLIAALAEGFAWWTRRESWLLTVRFLVGIAALSGVNTAALGWLNAYFSSYNKAVGALLWWHRWMGTSAAVWAVVCAALVFAGACSEGSKERQRFRGALLLGAALVAITGFLGSALIYGLDHYAW